jgi:hypothetical protein
VGFSPIRERSITLSFVKGELVGDFVEGQDEDLNGLNN